MERMAKHSSLLSRDAERRIAARYFRTRDPVLEEVLVRSCLRLVSRIAARYCRRRELLDDLMQEGNLGLVHGVRHFDPGRGVRLSTYVSYWIRAYILQALVDNWSLVKAGTTATNRAVFFNLARERARLTRLGLPADDARLARRFHMRESDFARLARHFESPELSLQAPDGAGHTPADRLAAADEVRPDVRVERLERRARVGAAVRRYRRELGARDRRIIDERWLSESPVSLERLSVEFGISRERVRQLEERLRTRFAEQLRMERLA
jgi:RNA polymerase sigma-32 factor